MKLLELFDKPTDYKWIKKTDTLWKGEFIAGELEYSFTADFITHHEEAGMVWEIFFANESALGNLLGKYKSTGTGNEVAVFSTVMSMIQDFANTISPDTIIISAANDEPSRVKLYARMAKRAGLMGYELDDGRQDDTVNSVFTFTKVA